MCEATNFSVRKEENAVRFGDSEAGQEKGVNVREKVIFSVRGAAGDKVREPATSKER